MAPLTPHVAVTILEGRSEEQLRAIFRGVTDVLVETIAADPDRVKIILTEVPPDRWASGAVTIAASRSAAG